MIPPSSRASPMCTPQFPSMTGKFELEYEGEMRGAENIARELIRAAVGKTFTKYFTEREFSARRAVV